MKSANDSDLLALLEQAPEQPLSPATLIEVAKWPDEAVHAARLRPRWLTDPALEGLSAFGLVAFQVGNGGHWDRLAQARRALHVDEHPLTFEGPISDAGLVWLTAGQPCRAKHECEEAVKWLTARGLSVDTLWSAARQTSVSLHTQNALDLRWWDEVMGWVMGIPHAGLPAPSATAGAHLVIQMDNGKDAASFDPRFVGDRCDEMNGESHPLPKWVATHADPDTAQAWIIKLLKRKRKAIPGLDEAVLITLERGARANLPARSSTLLPQSFARVRAARAGPLETTGRTARPRRRG